VARRRRKSSQTLLGIILCIPIAFIAYFAISYSSQNITPESVNSVSLIVPSGDKYTYNDSEQVDFFVNSMLDSKSISTPVREIANETPVTIQFDRGDKILGYKLYPQLNLSGCMVVDADGKMFLMTTDTAKKFLVRSELEYLYNDSLLPSLSIASDIGSKEVLPTSYTWHYKKVDEIFYQDKLTGVYDKASKINSVYPNKNSSFKFSVNPSDIKISFVTAQGQVLAVSDLSFLEFTDDTEIEVNITAKWNGLGGAANGEATYTFPILYDIPAIIAFTEAIYNTGDVAVLDIQYLNENEQITVSSQLDTAPIVCYTDISSGKKFALLPISNKNTEGEYTIGFSVGGISSSSTITVKQPVLEPGVENASADAYNQMLSERIVKECTDKLTSIFSQPSKEAYYAFGTAFTAPLKGSVLANYGKDVLISNDAINRKVIGTIYSVADGTAVKSAQKGKVVFAENLATTGNTLIIDHGYGVMTCYFNLKGFERVVGDIVQQGEIVAYSGSTGYTGGQEILDYAVAVNGIFVNPAEF